MEVSYSYLSSFLQMDNDGMNEEDQNMEVEDED